MSEKIINNESEEFLLVSQTIPIMPLRNAVLFPGQILPLAVGREKSINVIRAAEKDNGEILVTAQKDETVDDPTSSDIYMFGTICSILKILKLPDGTEHVVVQGLRRAKILTILETAPYFKGVVQSFEETDTGKKNMEIEALMQTTQNILGKIVDLSPQLHTEHRVLFLNAEYPERLADLAAIHLNFSLDER
jgi:ATP-dependent Lon protease